MFEPRTKRFKPRKFLKLAKQLLNDNAYEDRSKIRTSIGRAYYAAFLYSKNKLEQLGCCFPDDYAVHGAVIRALMEKDRKIGSKLESLKLKRSDSDYHLDLKIAKGEADYFIGVSENIINGVDLLRS